MAGFNTPTKVQGNVKMREDSGDSNITYIGISAAGSSTSDAVWKVVRMDITAGLDITWADGNTKPDNIWDNRESLSYS